MRELPALGPLAGVAVRADLLGDPGYAAALTAFGSVTPENELKWESVEPERGHYDFGAADRIVDFAQQHGMAVRGHTLVWYQQNPSWLNDLSAGELRAALGDHIRTLMRRYAGRITSGTSSTRRSTTTAGRGSRCGWTSSASATSRWPSGSRTRPTRRPSSSTTTTARRAEG